MSIRIPLFLAIVLLAASLASAQVTPDLAAAKQQELQAMGVRLDVGQVPAILGAPVEINGALDENSEQYDRIFSGSVSPGLTCSAASTDSTTGNGVFYQQFIVRIDGAAAEDLLVTVDAAGTTLDDPVLSLYCDGFDPQNPAANLVYYNDDVATGNPLPAFTTGNGTALEPGVEYRLVISTFAPGDTGTFRITLDAVTGTPVDVPVEVQSFSVD